MYDKRVESVPPDRQDEISNSDDATFNNESSIISSNEFFVTCFIFGCHSSHKL